MCAYVNAGLLPPAGTETAGSYSVEALGATVKVDSPLIGAHQRRNVALAIGAAVELASAQGFPITPESIAEGHSADALAGSSGAHQEERRGLDSGCGAQSCRRFGAAGGVERSAEGKQGAGCWFSVACAINPPERWRDSVSAL
jgi:hypothetical protein